MILLNLEDTDNREYITSLFMIFYKKSMPIEYKYF